VPESTFTIRLDPELKSAFTEVAREQDRTAAQLLRVLMRDEVQRWRNEQAHDAWFRAEVERAVGEADDADTKRIAHDEVRTSWREQRAELERRAAGKSA
jgi:predicted transcriptional regulator